MSTSDEYMLIPAKDLKAGMFLDLEDDPFASMISSSAGPQEREDFKSTHEMLIYEYAIVAEVEQEDAATTVVHCELISFACPPYHQVKVATHAWADESDNAQHGMTQEQFTAAFNVGNTADNN
jgi:hypothetical protein